MLNLDLLSLTLVLHIGGSVFSLFALFHFFILFLYFASLHDQLLDARFGELGLALSLTLDCTSVDQFSLDLQRNGSSGLQLITSDLALECNSSKWRFQLHFFKAGQKQKHTFWIASDKENNLKKKTILPGLIYLHLQGIKRAFHCNSLGSRNKPDI